MLNKKQMHLIFTLAIFCCSINIFSQVAMELKLNRKEFIKHEKIYSSLRIRNMSAHPIPFSNNPKLKGKLSFEILSPQDKQIKPFRKEGYILGQVLTPGEVLSLKLALTNYYDFSSEGNYAITAKLSHPLLPHTYKSNTVSINVTEGMEVWKRTVGVPFSSDKKKNTKVKSRDYVLKTFYDGKNKVYCLVVEDKKYVYGIARIGYDIGGDHPECKIDDLSKLHILIKNSPKIYTYFVYDVNCDLVKKQVYKKSQTRPDLVKKSGEISVKGGKEAQEGVDYSEEGVSPNGS